MKAVGLNYAAHIAHQEQAPHFILGYNCANDVSGEGSWSKDLSNWRRKGSDTFGPVGPWIETEVEPHRLEIITRLNGREHDRGSTSGMVYDCYAIVSGISRFATLGIGVQSRPTREPTWPSPTRFWPPRSPASPR